MPTPDYPNPGNIKAPNSKMILWSSIFCTAGLVFLAITLAKPAFMHFSLARVTYYIILLLALSWIYIITRYLKSCRFSLKSIKRSYFTGLAFSFILTTSIFISVKPHFRVLADEANLLGVSKSMLAERSTYNPTMGNWVYWNFQPIKRDLEKRPFLFSFFTYLTHVLTGYNTNSPFIVNFVCLFTLFTILFILLEAAFGTVIAIAGILLVAAQPVVTQIATSGGFDLLSVLFTIIGFACLRLFLQNPSSATFELLWINLLMLAHTRYESSLFFIITMTALFVFRYIKIEFLKKSLIYGLTPLFFLPHIWQRLAIPAIHQFQTQPGQSAFSLEYFLKNTGELSQALFRFDFYLPYAVIINLVGVIGLLYFGWLFLTNQWPVEKWEKHLTLISATSVGFLWVILTSYLLGNLDQPAMCRFFSLFFITLSIFALFLAARIFKRKPLLILLLSIAAFLVYHPVSVEDRFSNAQVLPREYRHVLKFLDQIGHRDFRLITHWPGLYTVHNYAAVNFDLVNKNKKTILHELERHLYRDIYVVQHIAYKDMAPKPDYRLDKDFQLIPLYEIQIADYFLRISRVKIPASEKIPHPQNSSTNP